MTTDARSCGSVSCVSRKCGKHRRDELGALLTGTQAAVVASEHIHHLYVREFSGLTLANISSASNPMDGDTHAKVGVLDWKAPDGWQVEIMRVEYDIAAERSELELRKPLWWESLNQMLEGERVSG